MLNLPHLEDILKEQGAAPAPPDLDLEGVAEPQEEEPDQQTLDAINRASSAITAKAEMTDGRDHAEAMDELYDETRKHSQDLMDLGFNVDVRSAARIFEVAALMYKNSIEAKNHKREAQLKFIRLMLEQRKLDLQAGKHEAPVIEGAGVVIENRNDLIRRLREQQEALKKAP